MDAETRSLSFCKHFARKKVLDLSIIPGFRVFVYGKSLLQKARRCALCRVLEKKWASFVRKEVKGEKR